MFDSDWDDDDFNLDDVFGKTQGKFHDQVDEAKK
jgi:hypothetical protein